jgi:hypothetical protein
MPCSSRARSLPPASKQGSAVSLRVELESADVQLFPTTSSLSYLFSSSIVVRRTASSDFMPPNWSRRRAKGLSPTSSACSTAENSVASFEHHVCIPKRPHNLLRIMSLSPSCRHQGLPAQWASHLIASGSGFPKQTPTFLSFGRPKSITSHIHLLNQDRSKLSFYSGFTYL